MQAAYYTSRSESEEGCGDAREATRQKNKKRKKIAYIRVATAAQQRCTVNRSAVRCCPTTASGSTASGSVSLSNKNKQHQQHQHHQQQQLLFLRLSILGPMILIASCCCGIRAPPRRRTLLQARPAPRHIHRGGEPPPPLLLLLLVPMLLLPQRGEMTRTSCHHAGTRTSMRSPFWNDAS